MVLPAIVALAATAALADEPPLSFNRDIRPILSDKCFACHGFDAKQRQADLRLDTEEGAIADHDGRRAIVPKQPAESELWRRVTSSDEAERMPPPDSNKTLSDAEKDLLKRWIEQGAPYQKHWSFEPITRPALPASDTARPIDAFLNARLARAGLTPQAEADRETLIRRVAITLTGLPPTLDEIDLFLGDSSASAYEQMVDRYLASPRYGEEMAKHWLDVARYADTHGLHLDNERQMWAYRDWVVKAFNQNLPFDQFTVSQLAGDQLPEPTADQLVATGFNRCNVTTSEGGALEAEFRYRYAVERASTTAQVWLGLTAGCAVCHDHKFDPLSTKEFYSLFAFFHSAADPAMDGNINNTAPFMKLLSAEQKAAAASAAKVEHEARAWLDTLAGQTEYHDAADIKDAPRKPVRDVLLDDITPLGVAARSSSRNPIDWLVLGKETSTQGHDPTDLLAWQAGRTPRQAAQGRRVIRQASASNYSDTFDFKLRPVVLPHEAVFEVQVWVDDRETPTSLTLSLAGQGYKSATWTKNASGVLVRDGSMETITPGQWTKLQVAAVDLGLKADHKIEKISLNQTGGVCYWDALVLRGEAEPATDPLESLAAWRKSLAKGGAPDMPGEIQELLKEGRKEPLTEDELAKVRRFYLAVVARPVSEELQAARTAWEATRTSRIVNEESPPGTFVFRDLPQPRESFVMVRGQYDKPGEKVEPAVPAILPPLAKSKPEAHLTRLDLAKWLVASENPLTARVTVNRLWQQVFGTGLVKTSFDFGSQGEPPSHPELLDYLAAELRESGWNVKAFMKQLLMSDAFRRVSLATPETLVKDPSNRLLARGPRFRLDAEQIRDNALFVSGLMDFTMGGRGVKPYQPANIWEPVGYSDSNTRFYQQDHGPALYRRSIYVFLKRTAPPPFLSNFDGPNREQVCAVRERSNTPLQALQLMNDVQQFEAARALAERTLEKGGNTDEERLTYLYRTVLSRRPDGDENQLVLAALAKQRELYKQDAEAAKKAVHVGESKPKLIASVDETAAWTMVANLVLNLDETLNRN